MVASLTVLKFLDYKHALIPNPLALGLKKEKLREGESCRAGELEQKRVEQEKKKKRVDNLKNKEQTSR